MTLKFHKRENTILEIVASGKLCKEDYTVFIQEAEDRMQQYGKLRLLIELRDFHGWDGGALWEDLKFDVKHFHDIERIAVIGETTWQAWMTTFFRPFTAAQVRYFTPEQAAQARAWIETAHPSPTET